MCGGVVPSGRQTIPVPARWRHTAGCLPGVGGSIHSGQRDNSFEKCPPSMLNTCIAHIYLTLFELYVGGIRMSTYCTLKKEQQKIVIENLFLKFNLI